MRENMPTRRHGHRQWTAACIAGKVEPPPQHLPCASGSDWQEPQCLHTRVPAWEVPFSRVAACFRCCIHASLSRCGLLANYPTMLDLIMRKSFDPWWNGLQDFNYAANWRNSSWGIIKGAETYEPTSVLLGDMAFLRLAHIGGPYIGKGTNAPLLVHTRGTSGPAPCGSFTLAVIQGWHLKKHERAIDALYRLLRGQSSQERDASKDSALHNAMRYPMVLMVMGDLGNMVVRRKGMP